MRKNETETGTDVLITEGETPPTYCWDPHGGQ